MRRRLFGACALLGTIAGLFAVAACGDDAGLSSTFRPDAAASGQDGGDPGTFVLDGGADGTCSSTSRRAEKVPLDMLIGLDTSFSMDFDQKWTSVKRALEAFVRNPAYEGLALGLQFFPIRKQCSVADYAVLAVDLDIGPKLAGNLTAALEAQQMAGGTPMVPLLQGLTAYARANARPGRRPVIVLATDGVPDDTCVGTAGGALANTLENAVAVAAQALGGTPSIPVFVIGVGKELSALNGIASAGGTAQATLVDTGGNAQQAFLDALDKARRQAIPCDFTIPVGSEIDPTKMNVTYAPAGAPQQTFVFVGKAEDCAKATFNGWYFDDPLRPTKVILCGAACDAVKADDRGQVDVQFGCPRIDVR